MDDIQVKSTNYDNVFSVIQRSYRIEKHIDFFIWMQNCVAEMIPHDLLLTAWGGFGGNSADVGVHYDVASNVKGISTQEVWKVSADVDACVAHLHSLWVSNNRQWYTLNYLDEHVGGLNFKAIFPDQLAGVHSLLVYGVSDLRGKCECLYVFFGSQNVFKVDSVAMTLLMPHIDNTLRRIAYLEPADVINGTSSGVNLAGLSERELEVIDWIKTGKTNQEIGMILNISQNTVKSHLKRIFQKLNVSKRAQAVALLADIHSTKYKEQHVR